MDIDTALAKWLADESDMEAQHSIKNHIEGLALSRLRGRLRGQDEIRELLDRVNADIWRMVSVGRIPNAKGRVSTIVCTIAERRIRDIIRDKYSSNIARNRTAYAGTSADLDTIASDSGHWAEDRHDDATI